MYGYVGIYPCAWITVPVSDTAEPCIGFEKLHRESEFVKLVKLIKAIKPGADNQGFQKSILACP